MMEIQGLGLLTPHERFEDWLCSQPIAVAVLGGESCRFVLEGYGEDTDPAAFERAIANFLTLDPSVLRDAEPHIFRYYRDCFENSDIEVEIAAPPDLWQHIQLAHEVMVSRRFYGDRKIYLSLDCGCDWEEEHGLQIVFKEGLVVNKVGSYDGHLSNADAFDDPSLEEVVYA